MKVIAYFDGAAIPYGRVFIAAWGCIAERESDHYARHGFIGCGTNNEAEYHGAINAIRLANEHFPGADERVLIGDSQLVIRQATGEYRVKAAKLKFLHAELLSLANGQWKLEWVPRELNGAADSECNLALMEHEKDVEDLQRRMPV